MKLWELFEDISPEDNLNQMVQDYFISLKANGITEVPSDTVLQELRKKSNINITPEHLSMLVGELPMVTNMSDDTIEIADTTDMENDEELGGEEPLDADETVSDMASDATDIKGGI